MDNQELNTNERNDAAFEARLADLFNFDFDAEEDDELAAPFADDELDAFFELSEKDLYEMHKERLLDELAVWDEGEREEAENFVREYEKKAGLTQTPPRV